MKLLPAFFLLILLAAAGCNDAVPGNTHQPVSAKADNDDGTKGDFYMRLSGTIAGRPVIANLHKYGASLAGYYEYAGSGRPIKLLPFEDTIATDGHYYLTEVSGETLSQQGLAPHWAVMFSGDKITGKWMSADSRTTRDILLTAAYPQGSIALAAHYFTDTARMWKTMPYPNANAAYGIVWPHAADHSERAAFLRSALSNGMGLEASVGAFTALKTRAWRYFGNYRLDIKKVLDSTATEDARKGFGYHYATTFYHYILYNDQDWFIIESGSSNYTGGAHGTYSMTYMNLDLSASKAWVLKDVVTDTAALRPLLNAAARGHFGLPEGSTLDGRMLVNEVPVTGNFYLNAGGLTFVYNPYDIASYADGTVSLFIPYQKLMPLLTPEFKQRATLEGQSGSL